MYLNLSRGLIISYVSLCPTGSLPNWGEHGSSSWLQVI
uniref:Uncharacterized protein n=1 Tax=Anguilla anguilla TaxID=7936 RepID=A0A0E9SPK1_ANGAN